MRLYLDTNALVYLVTDGSQSGMEADLRDVLFDYSTTLMTSTVCVQELLHLIHIGKVKTGHRKDVLESAMDVLATMDEKGINIVPVSRKHLERMATLPIYDDHRDPNDRLIVAQAISDRIPLVSSDRKFKRYERYGLEFVFNER